MSDSSGYKQNEAVLEKSAEEAFQAVSKKALAYVEKTQPVLDKYAEFRQSFSKKAQIVAGTLAQAGLIGAHEVPALLTKLGEDPVRALDLVIKLAGMIGADELGQPSEVKRASGEELDPFDALVLYGDPEKTRKETSLNVD